MGIFDIFKKKPQEHEGNRLEVALQKAAKEPAWRKTFYELLLTERLVVMTSGTSVVEEGMLKTGAEIAFVTLPDGRIPVFTSVDRIFDKQVIKDEVHQMTLKGRDLFELAVGASFILNPYSDYGKDLLPGEIADLLNGTIFSPPNTITVQKDTQVLIGQPAEYPLEAIASLKEVFAKYDNVNAAYLGWIDNPESDDPAHYIFAVEGNGDFKDAIHEAGFVAQGHLGAQIFDIMRISGNRGADGIEGYFIDSVKPFYKR